MKLTKRHKIWIGALSLGLAALAVDRFVLTQDPASADASAAPAGADSLRVNRSTTPTSPQLITAPAQATQSNQVAGADSLAFLLRGICVHKRLNVANVRDAFSPPPVLTRRTAAPPKPRAAPPEWSKKFTASHHLSGVMVAGRRSQALIDGKLIAIGQTVDGCKLIAVTTNTATFVREGATAVLALDQKHGASSPAPPIGTAMTE